MRKIKTDYKIIVDSREQEPLWRTGNIERKGLKTGDYSIEGHEDKFALERKSCADLFGTLGKGHARFKKELARADDLDYFAIIIDGSYTNVRNKEFEGAKYSKMKGYVMTAIVFTLHIKYGINIFFTNGRLESKKIMKELMDAYMRQQ